MFKLVIQDDEGKTTVVPLIRDEITIGRKEGNTIRLTERNVSRRHARILRNNGEVHIEDLGSYNGIRVNNARIAERVSLRVSDQVQIGDYKLYLKAEGVEQVDDARTMPIERVETNGAATEALPALAASATPTAQVPAQVAPSATPPVPPAALVGNPNRTMVAMSGDDLGGGRPVATAAAVAAMTQPVGHGKLVVLSSNFAGKEFDLSRGQMIIGRTDENDIVINHRSISRNHAKIVREPDSGRYTISDLQSSNGVRVNGQDYGKVELRRGDVVDLGHVRLRFIEPGEDFLFSRDAVITDVPESGGKRGMLVAIVLGVVVLGAGVAFFMMRGGDKEQPAQTGSDAGSQTRVVVPDLDARAGNDVVSDAAVAMVETPDASTGQTVIQPGPNKEEITLECSKPGLLQHREWAKQIDCATTKLMPLDREAAQKMIDNAKAEQLALAASETVTKSISNKSLGAAHAALDSIGPNSVYRTEANKAYEEAKRAFITATRGDLNTLAKKHACGELTTKLQEIEKRQGPDVSSSLSTPCSAQVAETPDHPNPDHPHPGLGSGSDKPNHPDPGVGSAVTVPVVCDAEEHKKKGDEATGKGAHAQALAEFEAALKCKPGDGVLVARAYMESCQSGNAPKAHVYFNRLPAAGAYSQQTLEQMCVRNHIDPRAGK